MPRDFIKPFKLLSAGVCLALTLGAAGALADPSVPDPRHEPTGERPPNILLLFVDDLNDYSAAFDGYTGAPGSGHPQAKTPHITRFLKSRDTTNFLAAYPPVPACKGVRTAIFTGLSPATTGVVSNASVDLSAEVAFHDYEYMHKYFRNRGYSTFWSGKVEHGTAERDTDLFRRLRGQGVPFYDALDDSFTAWDEVVSYPRFDAEFERIANMSGYDVVRESEAGELRDFFWASVDLDERHWTDYKTTSAAIRYMRDYRWQSEPKKPFFLAHGIINPHKPWVCPKPYFDEIAASSAEVATHFYLDGDLDDVGPIARRWAHDPTDPEDYMSFLIRAGQAERQKAVHAYLACSAFADAQVGRILEALRTYGLEKDTIVVLVSDHGYMTGEKNGWGKLQLWEDALRVPFGIRVPEKYMGGVDPRPQYIYPVSIGSIFSTLSELAFGNGSVGEFASLVPIIRSGEGQGVPYEPVLSFYGDVDNVSLRLPVYRYTHYKDGFEELYDHRVDDAEHNNVAARPEYKQKRDQACAILKRELPGTAC